jgi:hypothetical protein
MTRSNISTNSMNIIHPSNREGRILLSVRRWLAILLLLPCLLLTSCVTLDGSGASSIDPNPPADAIVGKWIDIYFDNYGIKKSGSFFFHPDGTGLSLWSDKKEDSVFWKYHGGGNWIVSFSPTEITAHHFRLRVSQAQPNGARWLHSISHGSEEICQTFTRLE